MSLKYTGNINNQVMAVYFIYTKFLWVRIWLWALLKIKETETYYCWMYSKSQHLTDWTEARDSVQERVSSHKWKQVIFKSHYDKLWVKDFSFLNICSVLSAREQNFGDRFLHVFLQDGRPVVRLGCSSIHVLTAAAPQDIRNNSLVPILVRWELCFFFYTQKYNFPSICCSFKICKQSQNKIN